MLEKRFLSLLRSAYRYVSPHSARRAGFRLAAALILAFALGVSVHAEVRAGDAASVIRQTNLLKNPAPDAESLGILPANTAAILKGSSQGKFTAVSVETENGTLEGWIDSKDLDFGSPESVAPGDEVPKKMIKVKKPKQAPMKEPRIRLPIDEQVLIRRDPTFSYGAHVGIHVTAINVPTLPNGSYSGMGLTAGVHMSYFVDPTFHLRGEFSFTSHGGASGTPGDSVGFNFMDLAVVGDLYLNPKFFLFGALQYSAGIGINALPTTIPLTGASDVSSLWLQAGAGYRFPISDISFLALRGRYMGAMMSSPMSFQSFGLLVDIEIQG